MTSNTEPTIKAVTIAANISALTKILKVLAARSAEAHGYALIGDSNAAMGALLDFSSRLEEARALYEAALALHRGPPL